MSLRGGVLLCALAGAVTVPQAVAQETLEADTVTVTGNVVDEATGDPIQGVIVAVESRGLTFVTDAEGRFVFSEVARGVYDLQLIHRDYERLEGDLTVDRPGEFFLTMIPFDNPNAGMVTGIVGIVTDQASGDPIPDVVVNATGAGRVDRTDAEGRFSLADLPPGRHEVVFSHLGYIERAESIGVEAGRVASARIVLAVDAIALDPIEVTVDRRDRNLQDAGFYQRREDGWGNFVDREDIEKWNPIDLTDALIRFPGVAIVADARSPIDRRLRLRGRGRGVCSPTIYLDGVMLTGMRAFSINDIVDPLSVAGIELYRGVAGVPGQYSGLASSCGVVLIWLRRGG